MTTPTHDVMSFSRTLATALGTGRLTLDQCLLEAAQRQPDRDFRRVVSEVRQAVLAGQSLSAAVAKYPGIFDANYVSVLRRGEKNGTLEEALEELGRT